ncbi:MULTISPECIES: hypothetical protein [unclassified Chryseobacterium]|uniref:hypothetical protein n=1 Tax=unclassified Chryseobacterium TaxID=2593645 RepID=UPI000D3BF651|nr:MULTISPECIES: hypothetical protein [unclassified Chryseobacterium]PTT77421.1 hypothetical protein DBR25_03115 [Chryseobacterium sp. HMWF001]PVV56228.1 hypothetical protein DD829_11770 [Chryseobacterium sp. HMWF035]
MKNKLFGLSALAIFGCMVNAQVGINTNLGQATLDVVGSPSVSSKLDGIIAPRLTGDQLRSKSYTTAQTGALVYVTAADTAPAAQTVNVVNAGYYYFDGSVWIQVNQPQPSGWKITGNSGTTATAASLGTAVSSGNFLGTTDSQSLVLATNNTVKAILDVNGNLRGGNSNASSPYASVSWGSNNTLSNNTSSNIALGRENTVAAQAANFPGVAIGATNSALSGAKIIGNNNFATGANAIVLGNNNGTSGTNVSGINIGNSNVNSGGFAFGAGNNVTSNNYAFGSANVASGAAGSIAFGNSASATIANQTVYGNISHAFSGQGLIGTAITDVGVNMTPNGTNIPDLEISKGILIKATGVPVTSDCNASNEGTIVYGKSGNTGNFYGCKISAGVYAWQQL